MTIFGKIRKFFEVEEKQRSNELINSHRVISFNELEGKIDEQSKILAETELKIKNGILMILDKFYKDVEEAITNLDNVDLSKRKEQERIKIIVEENKLLYKKYLNNLVDNLRKEKQDLKLYINGLYSAINDFVKTSKVSYEKATYLIGNELRDIKEIIRKLGEEIHELANVNKEVFIKEESIRKIKFHFEELEENDTLLGEVHKKLEGIMSEIENVKIQKKELNEKISNIKNSEDYEKDIKDKLLHHKRLEDLNSNIYKIKNKIDFKRLSKIFHYDSKKYALIQDYSSNFKRAIENDSNLEIVNLLEPYDSSVDLINELKQIGKSVLEFKNPFISRVDKEISESEETLKKLDIVLHGLQTELDHEKKKESKFKERKIKIVGHVMKLCVLVFPGYEITE